MLRTQAIDLFSMLYIYIRSNLPAVGYKLTFPPVVRSPPIMMNVWSSIAFFMMLRTSFLLIMYVDSSASDTLPLMFGGSSRVNRTKMFFLLSTA